jgi:hypothetical protein
VVVYRDDWGVPHVYADREDDGFYGLGYAQAENRLSGILKKFLAVRGESASVFGPGAVEADLRAGQWMHLEQAQRGYVALSRNSAGITNSFLPVSNDICATMQNRFRNGLRISMNDLVPTLLGSLELDEATYAPHGTFGRDKT